MQIKKTLFIVISLFTAVIATSASQATIVRIETNQGNFEVNLYDAGTPKTVANFLSYVNNGDYSNIIIHRTVPTFIVQGGGFAYNGGWPAVSIFKSPAVANEPVYANVRGTIAMAKLGGNANSATNQWFINLADNRSNLDNQNGGFTVFGEVTGTGMTVIDQIAAISRYNLGGAFAEIPLQNYAGSGDPDDTNLVIISAIVISDDTVNSASGLNPTKNANSTSGSSSSGGSGGGGSMGIFLIGLLLIRKFLH